MSLARLAPLAALIVTGACRASRAAPPAPVAIEVHGALRELMHGGSTEGRVAVADVVTPTSVAVGALAGLRGEVTILDGVVHTSRVEAGSVVAGRGPGDQRAALLVSATVPAWRVVPITDPIAADDLERRVGELLRDASAADPTPFVIEGSFPILDWHVVDGPHQHGAPSGVIRATPGAALLVGFYSTKHEGTFTHMGQTTHVHVIAGGETGHVDRVAIDAGAHLRVP